MRRQKGVVFGAGVAGAVVISTSVAFACIPIVGYMAIDNVDPASTSKGTLSQTVGAGRAGDAWMEYCSDVSVPVTDNDGIVGGAEASQGDRISIQVAPAVCADVGSSSQEVEELAGAVQAAFNRLPSDPVGAYTELVNALANGGLGAANFLFPDVADIHYHPNVFDGGSSSSATYTFWWDRACMFEGGESVREGSMFIEAGVGATTITVPGPNDPAGRPEWELSPVGDVGGVCVTQHLAETPPVGVPDAIWDEVRNLVGPAMSMAPLGVFI